LNEQKVFFLDGDIVLRGLMCCNSQAVRDENVSLSRAIGLCGDFLKHRITLLGKEYRRRKIKESFHDCHLPVIILLEIILTSDIGGSGAFVHTCCNR